MENATQANLGADIPINGARPEWLKDGEKIGIVWGRERWDNLNTLAEHVHGWESSVKAIRLPADHPYYLATSKGFTYWPGGESAPDADEVLFRNGSVHNVGPMSWRWTHGTGCDDVDIIGYRRKAEPVVNEAWPDAFKSGTITVSQITRAEAYEDGLDIATLERLGLLKEETLLERFEREHGGLDNNQRDIVAAYQEWVAAL